jgi:2-dehydro-3-deoxyglucarate aldolase
MQLQPGSRSSAVAFPRVRPADEQADIGTIISLPDPRLLELAALAGSKWTFLDCEHGAVAPADLGRVLAGAPEGVPILVRLPSNDEIWIKQALDAGAAGVICPVVEDAATTERLVRWAKYPPRGARSIGIGRAHGYGLSIAPYLEVANATTSVVVQVESITGAHALDEILAVDGLGGVFIGPYDLSASMGLVGQPEAPAVRDVIADIVRRCRRKRVPVGRFYPTGRAYADAQDRDLLDFVAIGIDLVLLADALRGNLTPPRSDD